MDTSFILNVSLLFVNLMKITAEFVAQKKLSGASSCRISLLIRLISNWNSCRTIQRLMVVANGFLISCRATRLSNWNFLPHYFPSCISLSPVTVTNNTTSVQFCYWLQFILQLFIMVLFILKMVYFVWLISSVSGKCLSLL